MKIVMSNYHYRPIHTGGGQLHIEAFIEAGVRAGHALYAKPACAHPAVRRLAPHTPGQWRHLRDADLHYVRLEGLFPAPKIARWFSPPLRRIISRPLLVWEFNTVPEQGACVGLSRTEIELHKTRFRKAALHCDLAVCVSEPLAKYVQAELGVARTIVVSNGADIPPPHAGHDAHTPRTPGEFTVLWAGSAHIAWHDFELLLSAARLLEQDPASPRIRFDLYGVDCSAAPADLCLPSNVRLRDATSHEVVRQAALNADAGVCCYLPGPADYSSPLKFYDGLACGLPMITTPHAQMDAVHAEIGTRSLIVHDRDPRTFARILSDLADDEPRRRELGRCGREMVRRHYTWTNLMENLFERLETAVRLRRDGLPLDRLNSGPACPTRLPADGLRQTSPTDPSPAPCAATKGSD